MNKNYILFYIIILFFSNINYSQTVLGKVQDNTNLALPSSYKFKEYVFAEPNDQGDCNGSTNSTASIDKIFFAQTHRRTLDHPFHFLIGHRPSLFQLSVIGSGNSPDVKVEGFMNGTSLGEKCLNGPSTLSETIDTTIPDFEKYFSVTLPKSWVKIGLTLKISIGSITRNISAEELKIGPYTEMNLVQYDMDVLDYNSQKSISQNPLKTKPDNFLQEIASAIPASVIRYGIFPEKLVFPEIIANNGTEQLVRLQTKNDKKTNGINSDGSINSITSLFLSNLHASSSDYLSTIYFGNTMNLRPGGWGGGRSFVSFDFDDVFIHELGHSLSLPHWGLNYKKENPGDAYVYPYGGDPANYNGTNGNGGGRGESWNFVQHSYEFVSPTCGYDGRGVAGIETSDAMQRNNFCLEKRTNGSGPWDGFGDFSALAMHRFLVGASQKNEGKINYRSNDESFQFSRQDGFPVVSLENNKRVYKRHSSQPTESYTDRMNKVLLEDEKIEQDVYLIYGTTHPNQSQANIIYKPIKTKGTLPKIIDPTNQSILDELKSDRIYMDFLGNPHDITYKVFYKNGEILHLINPTNNYSRTATNFSEWRTDLSNFSIIVPADKEVIKVELYKRPFCVRGENDNTEGNINYYNDINADNFMDDAIFLTDWVPERKVNPELVNIGGTVWNDLNRNSIMDPNERGIENVSVYLHGDSNDDDGIPDGTGNGTNGTTKTNSNGEYFFSGLPEGNYRPFVWSVDNWNEDQPLHNYLLSPNYTAPNNDIDSDNNATGSPGSDLNQGIYVELSAGNEPLNDGDKKDNWWNIDGSSNRTVDFGFYNPNHEDSDEDGVEDGIDNCPEIYNPEQKDFDEDGVGDVCDGTPTVSNQSVTTIEDTLINITLLGTDIDGDMLTYSIVDNSTNGTVSLDENKVNYTPNENYNGEDSFTFKVNDGSEDSNTAIVNITVTAVNDAPVAVANTLTVLEDAALTSTDVIANDTDVDGDTLSLTAVSTAGTGTVAINADNLSIDYTPAANFNGTEIITYTVSDGTLTDATGTFTITVNAVNDAPVASAQSVTTIEDVSLDVTLAGTDPESDALTYAIVTSPSNGTVTLVDNKAIYVPSQGFFGSDSFTFKVNDGTVDSSVAATVSITVTSNDLDGDGVLNDVDECPNTPEGDIVDLKGCTVFTLPFDNNKVSVTSAACEGTFDGSISLSVEDNSFDYYVNVFANDLVGSVGETIQITGLNKTASVENLAKGTYNVCFMVIGQPGYKECFGVMIDEPLALNALLDVDKDNRTASIQLSGSKSYNIDVNGVKFKTEGNNFTTSLPTGLSIINISTNQECQVAIVKEIFISEDILYYPNPTGGDVSLHVTGELTTVQVSVFGDKGDLIFSKEQQIEDFSRKTNIDLSTLITGIYIVLVEGKSITKTFKIVKK